MSALAYIMAPLVYIALSLFVGIGALFFKSGTVAASILGASFLAPVAAGCIVAGIRTRRFWQVLLGVAGCAATVWLSLGFDFVMSGIAVSGLSLMMLGYMLGVFEGVVLAA